MDLQFPDAASLAAALRDGAASSATARRGLRGGRAADGSVWIESPAVHAGVDGPGPARPPAGLVVRNLRGWAELVPPTPAPVGEPDVVLFHVRTAEGLARL